MADRTLNTLLDDLENSGIIDNNGKFIITQNADGIDTEDRIEKLKQALDEVTNK